MTDVLANVPRETRERLLRYQRLVLGAGERQNLIARSTREAFWQRHILDGAQLLPLAPPEGTWLDIGSGAGLPGMVVAILSARQVVLVEPRRLRADFLRSTADELGLRNVVVEQRRIEAVCGYEPAVISARAVASLSDLFRTASHLSSERTLWILPKGRGVHAELATARENWQGRFDIHPSCTDPEAGIVVGSSVRERP